MDASMFLRNDFRVSGTYWPGDGKEKKSYFSLELREDSEASHGLDLYIDAKDAKKFANAIREALTHRLTEAELDR